MSENTKLWDILGRTDPKATKGFTRVGGFKGTAIKPIWSFWRMTEEFGPCGKGWGVGHPQFQVVPGNEGEVLVYCTASIWYRINDEDTDPNHVYGVGGDKVVGKNKYGLSSDDEAFKKAYTDALTNALKLIGVGADVHMGQFDDNKYVDQMRQEFAEEPAAPKRKNDGYREDGTKTSFQLKKEGSWDEIDAQLTDDLADCHSLVALEGIKTIYRAKAIAAKWNKEYLATLVERFGQAEAAIRKQIEAEDDTFPGDKPSQRNGYLDAMRAG